MSVEKLARVLLEAEYPNRNEDFLNHFLPEWRPQAERILADPDPLLDALAEAGVLTEEREASFACNECWTSPVVSGDHEHSVAHRRRYVTGWRSTDARA